MQQQTTRPRRRDRQAVPGHPGLFRRVGTNGKIVPNLIEFHYIDSGGRRRWKTIHDARIRDAVAAREELRSKIRRGERVAPAEGRRTIAELASTWLDGQHHLRPRTRERYEVNLRVHIVPRLGRRRLDSIDADDAAQLIRDLRDAGRSPWTIRNVTNTLSRLLGHAVRRGWITRNPVSDLERGERPAIERREVRVLDREEIGALLAACRATYRPLLTTAVFTGVRLGELLGLTWADVDFDAELIYVRKQLGRDHERAATKTPAAVREVVLMPALARLLRDHRERALKRGHAAPEQLVFLNEAAQPFSHRNVSSRGLEAAAEKAGLSPTRTERKTAKEAGEPIAPALRFHDLRHTFASMLIAQGHDVVFVSRQLGHARVSITLDVYAHLLSRRAHADRARAALEAEYGSLLGGTLAGRSYDGRRRQNGEAAPSSVASLREDSTGGV